MKQKPQKRQKSLLTPSHPSGPMQDGMITRKHSKQSSQFPTVGSTLSSYGTNGNNARFNKKDQPPKKRRFFRRFKLKKAILLLLVVLIGIGIFFGIRFTYDLHKAFGGNIFDALHTSKLKGEDTGRVNMLIAGEAGVNSGQPGGPQLTDSIMLVSLDVKNNTGWLMSIPRDLYVNVPGEGYAKINSANETGISDNFSASGYPNGGMGLLEQTVSQKFNIPIDYYALIDYDAFKQAVDAVGGIQVDIQSSDPRGLYDAYTHLKLANGENELDGQEALNLARARGDDVAGDVSYGFPNSDFDRTTHQREMLEALKTKATTSSVLANPIKISNLVAALGDNVKTDLSLSDVRRLYDLSKNIPNSKIASLSLNNDKGQDLLASYVDNSGQEDLVPAAGLDDYSDIQQFVAQQTSSNPVVQEGAKVVVLNGTDTDGLAAKYQTQLEAKKIDVDKVGDADGQITTTEIIDNSDNKDPATKQLLQQTFPGATVTTTNPYDYDEDFIVVLGSNQTAQ